MQPVHHSPKPPVVSASTEVVKLAMIGFFSSRRRHTRFDCDWSSDVCSSDLRWRWKVEQQTGKRRGQIWPVATPAIHDRMVMVKSIVVIPGLIFPGKIFVQVGHRKLDNRLRAAMSGKPLINWGYGASYRNMGDRQVSGKRLQKNSQRQCYQQAAYCECREGKMLKGARCWLCPNFLLSCRFCMYYFLQPGY